MATTRDIRTTFSLSGEQKYRDAVREINRNISLLNAEMRKNTAEAKASGESTATLAQKSEQLSEKIKLQETKVNAARDAVEQSTAATSDASEATVGYKVELTNAERQLDALKRELKETNTELEAHRTGLTDTQGSIDDISDKQKDLNADMKNAEKAYQAAGDKVKELKARNDGLEESLELQKEKLELSKEALEQSKSVYGETSDKTKQFADQVRACETELSEYEIQLKNVRIEMGKLTDPTIKVGESLEKFGKGAQTVGEGASKAGKTLTKGITLPVVALGTAATKAALDFDDAFVGVNKTVDQTAEQAAEMRQELRDMAKEMPTTAVELAEIAESAGQLGIQRDNITSFTKVVAELGAATNIVGQEGATSMAQFANVMQMSQTDFDRFGSSIVDLGNNTATTEKDILNMSTRIAAAGKQSGMTEAEVLGVSAALASLGLEAESGGTAFSKLLINMNVASKTGTEANKVFADSGITLEYARSVADAGGKDFAALAEQMGLPKKELKDYIDAATDLENFANVAGVSADQFAKSFGEDATGAVQTFITGLQNAGDDAIVVLDNMGISEVRLRDAILRTTGAGDLLTDSVKMSTDAWEQNAALTEEVEKKNESMGAQLQISKNRIQDAGITIGDSLLPPLADVIEKIADLVGKFTALEPEQQKSIIKWVGIAAAVGPLFKLFGDTATGIGKMTEAIGKLVKKTGLKKVAEEAAEGMGTVAASMATAAGETTSVSTGMTGLSGALGLPLGPLALAAGAVGLLTAAYFDSKKRQEEFENGLAGTGDAAKTFIDKISGMPSTMGEIDSALYISETAYNEYKTAAVTAAEEITNAFRTAAEERRGLTEEEQQAARDGIASMQAMSEVQTQVFRSEIETRAQVLRNKGEMTQRDLENELATLMQSDRKAQDEIKAHEDAVEVIIAQSQIRERALRGEGRQTEANAEAAFQAEQRQNLSQYTADQNTALNNAKTEVVSQLQAKWLEINGVELQGVTDLGTAYTEYQRLNTEWMETLRLSTQGTLEQRTEANRRLITLEGERQAAYDRVQEIERQGWSDHQQELTGEMMTMVMTIASSGTQMDGEMMTLTQNLLTTFNQLPPETKETAVEAMNSAIDAFVEANPNFAAQGESLKKNFKEQLEMPEDEFAEQGANAVLGLLKGVVENETELLTSLAELANKTPEEIKKALEIQSPSQVMARVGKEIPAGLAEGVTDGAELVDGASTGIWQRILGIFNPEEGKEKGRSAGLGIGQGANSGVAEAGGQAQTQSTSVWSRILSIFNPSEGQAKGQQAGSQTGQGVSGGIVGTTGVATTSATNLKSRVQGEIGKVSSNANASGAQVGSNVSTGIYRTTGTATGSASNLSSSVRREVSTASSNASSVGATVSSSLGGGIRGAIGAAVSAASSLASSVLGSIKRGLGIASPSKYAKAFGQNTSGSLGLGIEENTIKAIRAADKLSDGVIESLSKVNDADLFDMSSAMNQLNKATRKTQLTVARNELVTLNSVQKVDLDYQKLARTMANLNIVVKTNSREVARGEIQ